MFVTLFGIITVVRPLSQKASSGMFRTLEGIVTESNLRHPKKARYPMAVTGCPPKEDGIVRSPSAGFAPVTIASPVKRL